MVHDHKLQGAVQLFVILLHMLPSRLMVTHNSPVLLRTKASTGHAQSTPPRQTPCLGSWPGRRL